MKSLYVILTLMTLLACNRNESSVKQQSIEDITSAGRQDSIFRALISITDTALHTSTLNDSLAFLILPVQASCPSCRKKTIDSIVKYQDNLLRNHYIILSAHGGKKTIGSYFREQEYSLPEIKGNLFLDSANHAHSLDLYKDNPTIYYTHNQKAYKKVSAIPSTVKEDLREFFSGTRMDIKM